MSERAKAFWARVRQGVTILSDRRRYLREVAALQALAWMCRFVAFWFLLDAFRVGGSVKNVLLVFAVNQVAGAVPFTPGGAGVQQALLREGVRHERADGGRRRVLGRPADRDRRVHRAVGLGAIVFIFRFRSFKEVLHAGRASREAEREAERGGGLS